MPGNDAEKVDAVELSERLGVCVPPAEGAQPPPLRVRSDTESLRWVMTAWYAGGSLVVAAVNGANHPPLDEFGNPGLGFGWPAFWVGLFAALAIGVPFMVLFAVGQRILAKLNEAA